MFMFLSFKWNDEMLLIFEVLWQSLHLDKDKNDYYIIKKQHCLLFCCTQ